jgi:hypothetical protein
VVPDEDEESSPQLIVVLVIELCESVQLLVAVTVKEFVPGCTVGSAQVGGGATTLTVIVAVLLLAVPALLVTSTQ